MKYLLFDIILILSLVAIGYIYFFTYKNPQLNLDPFKAIESNTGLIPTVTPLSLPTQTAVNAAPDPFGSRSQGLGNISVRLFTAHANISSGQEFELDILLESGSYPKNGGHVFVKYDPQLLQVEDDIPNTPGVQVLKYKGYDDVMVRSADNSLGIIEIDVRTKDRSAQVASNIFGVVRMKAVKSGKALIAVEPRSRIYFTDPNTNPQTKFDSLTLTIN